MADNIHITEYSTEVFSDRTEAGQKLGEALKGYRLDDPLILAIPRGGIIIGNEIAATLKAELDITLSSKIGAPGNPEFAIGAVSENGKVFMDTEFSSRLPKEQVEEAKRRKMDRLRQKSESFRKARPKAGIKNRDVVVVDDGLATGATMEAALWSARQEEPARLIAAVPVASENALEKISELADEVHCLRLPDMFMAVGQFYQDFMQTSDEEVLEILSRQQKK
ncbi:MAG: phosphoribosyl transferase [Candidatus Omnitrophica bacterium]|nr:phosphoribosyl transferase [Candidatus Omnitrophota bacterium]